MLKLSMHLFLLPSLPKTMQKLFLVLMIQTKINIFINFPYKVRHNPLIVTKVRYHIFPFIEGLKDKNICQSDILSAIPNKNRKQVDENNLLFLVQNSYGTDLCKSRSVKNKSVGEYIE